MLVCACVYKGGGCRQTGSRGLQNSTGHHNSSAPSSATDRQAGLNADGSLIGICHQEPTKSIYLNGGNPALFSHSNKHTCIHTERTHYKTTPHIPCQFMTHHIHITLAWMSVRRSNLFFLIIFLEARNPHSNSLSTLRLLFCKLTITVVIKDNLSTGKLYFDV